MLTTAAEVAGLMLIAGCVAVAVGSWAVFLGASGVVLVAAGVLSARSS